jgi:S-formylglutathione hydrolase FrmB/uncharacterized membrane protein
VKFSPTPLATSALQFNGTALLLALVFLLLLVEVVVVAFVLASRPRARASWWPWVAVSTGAGALVGVVVALLAGPALDGRSSGQHTLARVLVVVLFAGLGLAVMNMIRTSWRRRGIAALSAFVLVVGVSFTLDAPHLASLTTPKPTPVAAAPTHAPTTKPEVPSTAAATSGLAKPTPDLAAQTHLVASDLYQTWHAPADIPAEGRLSSVPIPGLRSGFKARPAEVYLPPAALVKNAPALPVVILLSGQPASPSSVIERGHVEASLNALAARNQGLAPIVVVPDQLSDPAANPMCVDSPLGNSATYIMTDVTDWIRTHLHVMTSRDAWAIGGFSQGGTCSIQFATAHPDVFGSFVDISGEKYPTLGNDALSIRKAFHGSSAAYLRAQPLEIMKKHGPYVDELAVFTAGETDKHYGAIMQQMSAAASAAGMQVGRYISLHTGHDWVNATNGYAAGLGVLYQRFGLAATGQYLPAALPTP